MNPVGAIVVEGLALADKLAGFQLRLNNMATPAARKAAIMQAFCGGFITGRETTLLIQTYGLEEA